METGESILQDRSLFSSVVSEKLDKKVFFMRDRFLEPRQGRNRVAQGVSPGLDDPRPAFGTPLPPGGRGDGGEGGLPQPTACAVGYSLPPALRAEILNELLAQDTNFHFPFSSFQGERGER
jgi:hypothetical protein